MQHLDPSNATVSELGAYDPTRYFPHDIKVHPQWETSLLDSHLTLIWVKPLLNHMKIKASCCRKWWRWSYSVSPYIWPKSSGWFFYVLNNCHLGMKFPIFRYQTQIYQNDCWWYVPKTFCQIGAFPPMQTMFQQQYAAREIDFNISHMLMNYLRVPRGFPMVFSHNFPTCS
jgi:hypothetical protein